MAWTEERKQAQRERMKQFHQNKNSKQKVIMDEVSKIPEEVTVGTIPDISQSVTPTPNPDGTPVQTLGEQNVDDLIRQIQELKDMQWKMMAGQVGNVGPSVSNGKMTGTFEKYKTDPGLYPDPGERLAEEPKLQRFAFKINYELAFEVSESAYTTIDNVRTKEPKFKLELVRKMMDEETGDDTGGRYSVCQIILHEDPETALIIARQNGLPVDENDEAAFLNEMRYIRMRDWLVECFYPPKVETERTRKDTVIGGKLVQYWEVKGEEGKGLTKQNWDAAPKVKF